MNRLPGTLLMRAAALGGLLVLHASVVRADVVLDWNATMLNVLAGPPFPVSRQAAMTHLAIFEAVNAVTGDYTSYLQERVVAPAGASLDAAAAAAAHRVLITLAPAQHAMLNAALAASLAAVPDGQSKIDGIATGVAAATVILTLRQDDGASAAESYLPATVEPGEWQLTLGCPASGGSFAHWGRVRPFGLRSAEQFRPGPPPLLTSGTYSKDFNEVRALGALDSLSRTPQGADVAQFYARLSPVTWANRAAQQVAVAQGRTVVENARAFALLNMALSDAAVATFEAKYFYNFWRPETAIHAASTDGNDKTDPDVAFVPFIAAPCFPGYPSNHATLSYAAREVLERLYGPGGHDITLTTSLLPGVILHYTDFKSITSDVDDARVNGGIHFRFDQKAGGKLGISVGAYMVKSYLRPVHP